MMPEQSPISVCVVTTARADYGLLRWLIHDLREDDAFRMQLVASGSHLSHRHGYTINEIRRDGYSVACEIPLDLDGSLTRAMSYLTTKLGEYLTESRPDLLLVLGDRWELLPIASVCTILGIPIGHISGGEITEGAIDDSVRHAITKLAHIHFVANEVYANRVRQLGEEQWRICISGGPGLDNFTRTRRHSREALEDDLGLSLERPTALVTLHPPTNSLDTLDSLLNEFQRALVLAQEEFGLQYIFTAPNADPGAGKIETALKRFSSERSDCIFVPSLGPTRYISLMHYVSIMIGNSSSAFHEAPLAQLPAVNIGDRQKGRLAGDNVVSVSITAEAILDGIRKGMTMPKKQNFECPYGTGSASPIIRSFIKKVFQQHGRTEILKKKFSDLVC
jgi:UDP-hydrolysing UDP-N-acetyl-D-glucosamine 2-epimerase